MRLSILVLSAALIGLVTTTVCGNPETKPKLEYVPVEKDVKLEVLDWGGNGRDLVLLTGLGGIAQDFNDFAQKLSAKYHVCAITRRGYGASSTPAATVGNYSPQRLGDDVLAVCQYLKLRRPAIVGHSIAGEELSSIGSRHPEKIAGLVYLDAAGPYAFYNKSKGDFMLDLFDLERKLALLDPRTAAPDIRPIVDELVRVSVPRFERDLEGMQKHLAVTPPSPPPPVSPKPDGQRPDPFAAIIASEEKFTSIHAPVLAIMAVPHARPPAPPNADPDWSKRIAAWEEWDTELGKAQSAAVEEDAPGARLVILPHASHVIYKSNESEVLRAIDNFISGLN